MDPIQYETPTPPRRPIFTSTTALLFFAASASLFVLSLFFPGFHLDRKPADAPSGLALLLLGWIGLFGREVAWLANPILVMAWLCLIIRGRRLQGLIYCLFALGCSISFAIWTPKEWSLDEGGVNIAHITEMGPGYWLWISSIAMTSIGFVVSPPPVNRRPRVQVQSSPETS